MTDRIARAAAVRHNKPREIPKKTVTDGCLLEDCVITRKVLILAGDTDGNLGDLAIVMATCARLQGADPEIDIALASSRPERDGPRLGVTPLRRGWRGFGSLVRRARQADLVICGGGGLFQDDDSLVKMPYWALRLACVRLLAPRVAGLSIGAGPLAHPVSRLFGRLALKTLNPVSVRDPLALAVLQPLTHKTVELVPDPAFLLAPAADDAASRALLAAGVPPDRNLVGVALRRCFHTGSNLIPHKYAAKLGIGRNRGKAQMSAFADSIAAVLDDVVRRSNAHVVFMPTYNLPHENDAAVCEAVAGRMRSARHSLLILDDPALYKAVTGRLAVMLCGRMHPAILAAGQGTPVTGLAYNQKFFGMFSMLGQRQRCLSIAEFVANDEGAKLTDMLCETIRSPGRFRPDTALLAHATGTFIDRLLRLPDAVAANARPQTQQG